MTDPSHLRRFAALDLGSLTVRLAVAEPTAAGKFRVLVHRREITGLGQGLAATDDLAPEGMARTLKALETFQQVMSAHQVEIYRAVGTQALRQARNRQIFLDQVRDSLGLTVEVLSPEEEARLSLTGVLSVLDSQFLTAPVLVFDVGGGSSEFALVRPGQKPVFASLPLGVLTLSQARPLGDPPDPGGGGGPETGNNRPIDQFRPDSFGAAPQRDAAPGGDRRGGHDPGGHAVKDAGVRSESDQ